MYHFKEIFKSTIWGGNKISLMKHLPLVNGVGESWEISAVDGSESVVADGPEANFTLSQLIKRHGAQLLGQKVIDAFGDRFPLLIKFIDATDNLSIQVHPNDEQALQRHGTWGKTEMWFVLESEPDANLSVGFRTQLTKDEYVKVVETGEITESLKNYHVAKGDVFFLPPGRIHSIGSGTMVAEIQQTSDITYRIFDYNRTDKNGNRRQLHTELAVDVIDYAAKDDYRTHYTLNEDGTAQLACCKYFTTNLLKTKLPKSRDYGAIDSFVILICLEGTAKIFQNDGLNPGELTIHKGQTVLIPASATGVVINPSSPVELLETYV